MNKKLLLIFCFLLSAFFSHAQSYDWVTGGGSTDALSPSSGTYVHANNICTDDDGNVYVTSVVGGTGITADTFYEALANNTSENPHVLLASYRCDGTMRWAKLIESSEQTLVGNEYGNNGIVYSNGSIYIAGAFEGYTKYIGFDTTFSGNNLSFIARFDTLGQFKWIRLIGPDSLATSLLANEPGMIAVDGQGYIHDFAEIKGPGIILTSSVISDTNGTYDLKYDSTGNLVSAKRVQLDSVWTIARLVFNKQDDNFYTVLTPSSLYYFTYYTTLNSAVCAFRPDESMIWMDTTGQGGSVISLDYKGGNGIYISGLGDYPDTFSFGGITVTDTIFPPFTFGVVFKLDTNGVAHWVYNLQSNEGVDRFLDICILRGEKIAATGVFYGIGIHGTDTLRATSVEPLFLIVDSSGRTVTLDTFIATGGLDAAGNIITSDAVGNVYVGGTLDYTMSATGLTPYNSIGGATNFFLLKYGYDCSCLAAPVASFTNTGTPNVSFTYTGTTAGIDSIVWTYGDGHSDTGMISSHTYANGTYTACATVYTSCGSDEYCETIAIGHLGVAPSGSPQGGVTVFPNPVSGQLIIENAAVGTTVSLFNIVGQEVYYGTIVNSPQAVDMQHLPPGNYIVQLTDVNGNSVNKTVVKTRHPSR